MKHFILPFFALLTAIPFLSYGQKYFRATENNKIGENPYYILPKATLVFELPISHKTFTSSKNMPIDFSSVELSILKERYGIDPEIYNKIKGMNVAYEIYNIIYDSVKVSTIAKPDFKKVFFTDGHKKWNKEKSFSFSYGNDGLIIDGESSTSDKTFDIAVKALSGVVQVASAAFKGDTGKEKDSTRTYIKEMSMIIEEMEGLKDGISNFDIYKDTKSRLEKKYTQLFNSFFYSEKSKIETIKIYYTPNNEIITEDKVVNLFSFDPNNGKFILSAVLADQLWTNNQLAGSLSAPTTFSLVFKKPLKGIDQFIIENPNSDGFAYNIPAKIEVKVIGPNKKIVFNDFMKIPQFGIIGRVASKKNKLSFSLDPLTGELKKLGLGSSAIAVDQVGAGTSGLIELLKYQDAKLDLEIKRLEAKKKKSDLSQEQ